MDDEISEKKKLIATVSGGMPPTTVMNDGRNISSIGFSARCGAFGMHAPLVPTAVEARWYDKKKYFETVAFYEITPDLDSDQDLEEVLYQLPGQIANCSQCACGRALQVREYTLSRVGNEIELKGQFFCIACSLESDGSWNRMISRLSAIWKGVKKIEVGPDGFAFEKQDVKS